MKKLILFAAIILMVITAHATVGIHVDKPVAGQTIYKVNTTGYMIKWTVSGDITKNVKIRLFNKTGATKIYDITNSTPIATGLFLWTKNLINNTDIGDYVIRVKTIDDKYKDDSGIFHIKNKTNFSPIIMKFSKKPSNNLGNLSFKIIVSQPGDNRKYESGKPLQIVWNKNFGSAGKVTISLYHHTGNKAETLISCMENSGTASWTPTLKYSWPGIKLFIKISTPDNKISGKSGVFSVFNPPPQKNKVIARNPVIENKKTYTHSDNGKPECLFASLPLPGRAAGSKELKTGHYKRAGSHKNCNWIISSVFSSNLSFDLSVVKGKEVVRAELMLSLSDHIFQSPDGTLATNQYCTSQSRIFEEGALIKTFSIITDGRSKKISILNSVRNWATSNPSGSYSITIRGMNDSVQYSTSVCLKYYSQPILFVEYKE